jgi:hypothetical protein
MSRRSSLARVSGKKLTPPLGETMAHISDDARIRAVLGERGVGDLRQRPERLGEKQRYLLVPGFHRPPLTRSR